MDFSNFWWQGDGGGGGDAGDPIDQSLRFRGAQYLSGKPLKQALTTNTWSIWFKKTTVGKRSYFIGESGAGYGFGFYYTDDKLTANTSSTSKSTEVYRDPFAWYHLVVTGGDRYYMNGVEQVGWIYDENLINMAPPKFFYIGQMHPTAPGFQFKGYIAEIHFVDGQELPPTTFGRYNANGIWVPVDPKKDGDTAWYGANGFHLTFDPSDIGKDLSGNGNDFTATGFETTDQASPEYDIVQDSPTNNFATLSPLLSSSVASTNWIYNYANLGMKGNNYAGGKSVPATSPKYYWEFVVTAAAQTGNYLAAGLTNSRDINERVNTQAAEIPYFMYRARDGSLANANVSVPGVTGDTWTINDVIGIAVDTEALTCSWYKNGAIQIQDFDISPLAAVDTSGFIVPGFGNDGFPSDQTFVNFGQQPFRYAPPAGFEPLSTANMPAANLPDTITGTFKGNSNADGPFVYTGCLPARIQYGTVDVKYQDRLAQSNVDFLSNGFKVRSTTSNSGTVNYTVTTTHDGGEYNGNKIPFQSPAPAVSN